MVVCIKIRGKRRQLCVGDLDRKIMIQSRAIVAPVGDLVDYSESFVTTIEVWALVQTTRGSQLFDGVEISNPFTHMFYIMFLADLTFENWILFEDIKYKIQDIEDLDERHEVTLIKAIKKGDDVEANYK